MYGLTGGVVFYPLSVQFDSQVVVGKAFRVMIVSGAAVVREKPYQGGTPNNAQRGLLNIELLVDERQQYCWLNCIAHAKVY